MKDMLRLGNNDRKKYIIISVAAVLVIALITVSVIAVQVKHSKNKKKNIVENTTAETKTIQETTVQETTEEETTEEDTTQEESAEVVEQEVVEEFFENEISTENQKAFECCGRHRLYGGTAGRVRSGKRRQCFHGWLHFHGKGHRRPGRGLYEK